MLDDRLGFPNRANQDLLATVWFVLEGAPKRLKADVWLVKGRLFSLLFNQPPAAFFHGIPASGRPQVAEVKLGSTP